jgi:hypothetical protein
MSRRVTSSVLAHVDDAIACDAFCSLDDGLCHAIVLARDGSITDLTYETGKPAARSVIGIVPGARDVTAFWSHIDDLRNVITVTDEGEVWHFSRHGAGPWKRSLQRKEPGVLRVAGQDEHHHGLALTDEGEITDQPFHAVSAAVEKAFRQSNVVSRPEGEPEEPVVVGNIPSAIDIAALWADAPDPFVIVAESDGAVVELSYGIGRSTTRRELARLPGLMAVSACYVEDPVMGRCVAALTSAGEICLLRYGAETPPIERPFLTQRSRDIGCFKTRDRTLHIVLASDADVVDLVESR